MSFFYHKVYTIKYELKRAIREFVAQDEVRYVGQEEKPTTLVSNYLAPSEEVAIAHFKVRKEYEMNDPKYEFKFISIEEIKLDACLINVRLD